MKPRHRLVILAAFTALVGCGSDGKQPVDPPPSPPPLPAGVHALAGLSDTLPRGDLEPLRRIVGNARFVALGESTHTSGGYYQAKARLIRFMVEEMGFRVLAFETPWLEALPAARYVASCAGTPEAALAGLTTVWQDTNVRDLLRWMCEYNRAHPGDPVSFFGFDVQEPWQSAAALRQFVQRAAPEDVARAEPLRRCIGAAQGGHREFYASQEFRDHQAGRRDAEAHAQCMRGIAELEGWISAGGAALEGATSPAAVEEARLSLVALRAWEEQLWVPDPGGYQARDSGMAAMLRRVHALHTPGRKTIVWAWNWHIARRYEEVRGFDEEPQRRVPRQGARAMGSFLHDAFGADYLPIALIGYSVQQLSGTQPPLQTNPLSVERRLHDLGRGYLLADLRGPLGDTLLPPGRTYRVSQEWGDPYGQFAALLFLEHSPPMTAVQAGGR